MTSPSPPPPEQNIGPYYKAIGLVVLVILAFPLMVKSWRGTPFATLDIVIAGALVLLLLAVVRPALFDVALRRIAAALPFTKYGRASGDTGQLPAAPKDPR